MSSAKNSWKAPVLLIAGFLVIGIMTSLSDSEGLEADVLSSEQPPVSLGITAGEPCERVEEQEITACDDSDTSGKQIWICNDALEWEKWGGCTFDTL